MTHQTTERPVEILLVEDNPGDVRLMIEALSDTRLPHQLHVAKNGTEAIARLRSKGKHANNTLPPDLILLDWNMPQKDGPEVLAEIKADPGLKQIPVVILTSSSTSEDVTRAYNLHANCYIIKPIDLEQFMTVVRSIIDFWLTTVKLPGREDNWPINASKSC